ncbi:MAG: LytTR family DNA-binding domain-containing protein [Caulobacterales bacterium]
MFLALIGPFGTVTASLSSRLIYWLLLIVGGTGLGFATDVVVTALFDPDRRHPFLMAAVTAVVMTPPSVLAVYAVTRWLFSWREPYGTLLELAGPVLIVSLAMTFINALANRRPIHTHASTLADAPPPRFLERLPAKLRGAEIYAVEAEDHYLRAHTSQGSDLILMRLTDAVAELEGVEGAQTHRSWWVAKGAVLGARRIEGRAMLKLPNGVEAPVSRNYARSLRNEGWF